MSSHERVVGASEDGLWALVDDVTHEPTRCTIHLGGLLPDRALHSNSRLHWRPKYQFIVRQRGTWLQALQVALPRWQVRPSFTSPVRIAIKLGGVGRLTDVPNWLTHYGLKVLVDCLTLPKGRKDYGIGLIPDDATKYVTEMIVMVESKPPIYTEVTIELVKERDEDRQE